MKGLRDDSQHGGCQHSCRVTELSQCSVPAIRNQTMPMVLQKAAVLAALLIVVSLERGAAGPRGTTYCSTAGGVFGVLGALLRTAALGFEEGGTLSGGRLLDGTAPTVALVSELAAPDKPPVIWASSSSGMTIGRPFSAIEGSGATVGLEVGRGRNIGETLKILPTFFLALDDRLCLASENAL